MTLSQDDIDQLNGILSKHRRNAYNSRSSSVSRFVKPVVDHTTVVVPRSVSGSTRRFHGYAADAEPACGGGPRTEKGYEERDKVEAIRWFSPCLFCYETIDPLRGVPEDVDVTLSWPDE